MPSGSFSAESMSHDKFYLPPFCNDFLSLKNRACAHRVSLGTDVPHDDDVPAKRSPRPSRVHADDRETDRTPFEKLKGHPWCKRVGLMPLWAKTPPLRDRRRCGCDSSIIADPSMNSRLLTRRQARALSSLRLRPEQRTEMLTPSGQTLRKTAAGSPLRRGRTKGVRALQFRGGTGTDSRRRGVKVTSSIANFIRRGRTIADPRRDERIETRDRLDDSLQSLVESGYIERRGSVAACHGSPAFHGLPAGCAR